MPTKSRPRQRFHQPQKPKLVCEVAFAEWTEDEQMRQTTFLSLREDKDPKEEVREV
jgi:bifunctional non-homologous end joining protein LigD